MGISTFDLYLLITRSKNGLFNIITIQTDDTFILGNSAFIKLKSTKLEKAKLITKPIKFLT